MPDFKHLLNVSADDVKELPVTPKGQYLARVGQHKFDEINTKDGLRAICKVPLTLQQRIAGEGELPPRLPELTVTFWLTNQDGTQDEHTHANLKRFCDACGVETTGKKLDECLAATVNQQVVVEVGHRANEKNPDRPFAEPKSFGRA